MDENDRVLRAFVRDGRLIAVVDVDPVARPADDGHRAALA